MNDGCCPLCGARNIRRCFGKLRHCLHCGHCFSAPVYTPADPLELYDERYFQGAVYRDYLGEARERTEAFRQKLRVVRGLIPKAGNVLDVGCAAGFFTALMRERGLGVWGVEVSEFAAKHARETPGVEVFVGKLPEAGFPSGFFDLISFWDTLEHLFDPARCLREARRVLKDSGLLLVETVNFRTLSRFLLRERWPLFAHPYHLQYFSRRSLGGLLRREGFRIVRAIPIQTYVRVRGRIRTWRYYRSPLLRGLVGSLAGDVVLYAALKAPV